MSKRIYYNCHTHVFSKKCIPNSILGNGWSFLIRLLEFVQMNRFALFVIKIFNVIPLTRESAPRLKMFFRSFTQGNQAQVINHLIQNEYNTFTQGKYFKFVLLTLDMDTQSDKIPATDFANQIIEIAEYKKYNINRDQIIPFLSINPYNILHHRQPMVQFVNNYFKTKGFAGIKLYPAVGYYVDDQRMDDLWQYCEDLDIPIMSHCTCGRVHYQGKMQDRLKAGKIPYPHLKGGDLQCNFSDLDHFEILLKRHPKLKICFAHCGGVVFSKNSKEKLRKELLTTTPSVHAIEYKWYEKILEWCKGDKFPNIYFDISWINHDKKTLEILYEDVKAQGIMEKVLFGTDFFVNMDRITEKDAYKISSNVFDMDIIASNNPSKYLTSKVYEALAIEP